MIYAFSCAGFARILKGWSRVVPQMPLVLLQQWIEEVASYQHGRSVSTSCVPVTLVFID